jgi:uncharacterized protein YkwD
MKSIRKPVPCVLFFILSIFLSDARAQNRTFGNVRSQTQYSSTEKSDPSKLERIIFELTNKKRAENNLPALGWNEKAAAAARLHSRSMATENFFGHVDLNGERVDGRLDSVGFKKWLAVGENLYLNGGYDDPAEQAVISWMKSPTHRGNILNGKWQLTGVGAAVAKNGIYYFTQVFVKEN